MFTLTTTVVLPPEIAVTFKRGPGEREELTTQGCIANSKTGTSVRERLGVNEYACFSEIVYGSDFCSEYDQTSPCQTHLFIH